MAYKIGTKIKKHREAQNISQKEMARHLGVSNSRISNWETGLNRPDVDLLADICKLLNVSPSDLLDVHLDPFELSAHERKLIDNYRSKHDLRRAVDILMGVEEDE